MSISFALVRRLNFQTNEYEYPNEKEEFNIDLNVQYCYNERLYELINLNCETYGFESFDISTYDCETAFRPNKIFYLYENLLYEKDVPKDLIHFIYILYNNPDLYIQYCY